MEQPGLTLPHALVAGVPPPWARQVRAALDKVQSEGWTFSVFPGLNARVAGLEERQLDGLFKEAAERKGAHVFGVADGRNRQDLAATIREHFRFRWLPTDVVRSATTGLELLIAEITRAVAEEDDWRHALHPVLKSSPLALPQSGFVADRGVDALWSMCESFNKEQGFFAGVADTLNRFKSLHLKKYDKHSERFFIDQSARVWKDDGPYHGDAPFPRDWKYSSILPLCFHFDVQHSLSKSFEFNDRAGRRKAVAATKHCNVDAHGYLR